MSPTTPPPPPSTPAADPATPTRAITAPTPTASTPTAPASPTAAFAFDLSDPLLAIEHLARLFRLEVDTARELTYRADCPQPIKVGRRWLWFLDEVLVWARKQKRYSAQERKRNTAAAPAMAPAQPAIQPYTPRATKPGRVAA